MFDVDDEAHIKWSFCLCVLSIVLRLTERRTYLLRQIAKKKQKMII